MSSKRKTITDKELLRIIQGQTEISQPELRKLTGMKQTTLFTRIKKLKDKKRVKTRIIRQGRVSVSIVSLTQQNREFVEESGQDVVESADQGTADPSIISPTQQGRESLEQTEHEVVESTDQEIVDPFEEIMDKKDRRVVRVHINFPEPTRVCEATYGNIKMPKEPFESIMLEKSRLQLHPLIKNPAILKAFLNLAPHLASEPITPVSLQAVLQEGEGTRLLSPQNVQKILDHFVTLGLVAEIDGGYQLNHQNLAKVVPFLFFLYDPEFRKSFQHFYQLIFTLTCLIARDLRFAFPQLPTKHLYTILKLLMGVGITIAYEDLEAIGALKKPCYRCMHPMNLEDWRDEMDFPERYGLKPRKKVP